MAKETKGIKEIKEITVEERLNALYELQKALSEVDKIKVLRGELPLEVQDLEDEIAGLETRIEKYSEELRTIKETTAGKKIEMQESKAAIAKYEEQQSNVRNNREYDFLSKEIEFQTLEIELSEKRIKEFAIKQKQQDETLKAIKELLEDRKQALTIKQSELDSIVAETQAEEERLLATAETMEAKVGEARILNAFFRIRSNAKNGLAVVAVARGACGGCFNRIPPQRELDIRLHKKVIVCEYCGRILVDASLGVEPEALPVIVD